MVSNTWMHICKCRPSLFWLLLGLVVTTWWLLKITYCSQFFSFVMAMSNWCLAFFLKYFWKKKIKKLQTARSRAYLKDILQVFSSALIWRQNPLELCSLFGSPDLSHATSDHRPIWRMKTRANLPAALPNFIPLFWKLWQKLCLMLLGITLIHLNIH